MLNSANTIGTRPTRRSSTTSIHNPKPVRMRPRTNSAAAVRRAAPRSVMISSLSPTKTRLRSQPPRSKASASSGGCSPAGHPSFYEEGRFTAPADKLVPEEATGGDSHTW